MRTAFIQQLIEEARIHEDLFLLVGDLGYSVVEPFAEAFPDRFLNVGIAEQNMTGVAAGLAKEGYNVFTYSIGNFPTLRCMEQIRYDVCYHDLSVKIVAVGGGYAYGPLGVSHHTTEDIGMLRTIPNITVTAPGDPVETKLVTRHFAAAKGPGYIRLGKAGEPLVHTHVPEWSFGAILPVQILPDASKAVLSTGGMLADAVKAVETGTLQASVYSIPVIKPIDEAGLLGVLQTHSEIITMEEHQHSSGFGSAVLEAAHRLYAAKKITHMPVIRVIAIPDRFIGYAGTQEYLRREAGLFL